MKSLGNSMLLLAVAVTTLTLTAAAQNVVPRTEAPAPSLRHAVFVPALSTAKFTQVDWDDHRRCDGDHDRDDRHCHWRDRDGARYYFRGTGYVGYAPHYAAAGWYDNRGRWHPAGWYDRYGRWHAYRR